MLSLEVNFGGQEQPRASNMQIEVNKFAITAGMAIFK